MKNLMKLKEMNQLKLLNQQILVNQLKLLNQKNIQKLKLLNMNAVHIVTVFTVIKMVYGVPNTVNGALFLIIVKKNMKNVGL